MFCKNWLFPAKKDECRPRLKLYGVLVLELCTVRKMMTFSRVYIGSITY
jgi:hypothetical protein